MTTLPSVIHWADVHHIESWKMSGYHLSLISNFYSSGPGEPRALRELRCIQNFWKEGFTIKGMVR